MKRNGLVAILRAPGGFGWLKIALSLSAAAFVTVLTFPSVWVRDAVYVSFLPVACLAVVTAVKKDGWLCRQMFSGVNLVLAGAFTLLFFFQMSVLQYVGAPTASMPFLREHFPLPYAVFVWCMLLVQLLVSVVSMFLCLIAFFSRTVHPAAPRALQADEKKLLRRTDFGIATVSFVSCVAAFPTYFFNDVIYVWGDMSGGHWKDWHTMGYLLFVKLCSFLINSPFSVVLVQTLLWIAINHKAVRLLKRYTAPRACWLAYLAVLLLVPTVTLHLHLMLKDVVYSLCLLGLSLCTLELLTEEKASLWLTAQITAFGLGICLFRHAGTLPVAAVWGVTLLWLLVQKSGKWKQLLAAGAACTALYVLLVPVLSFGILKAERNPSYTMYSVPMGMIGAVASSDVDIAPQDLAVMEKIMPREKWAYCYNKYCMDPISRVWDRVGEDILKLDAQNLGGEILKLNFRFLLRYPNIYMTALMDATSIVWQMGRPSDGYETVHMVSAIGEQEGTTLTGASAIVVPWGNYLTQLPIVRSIGARGGLALFCLLLCVAGLVRARKAQLALPLGYAMVNTAVLVLGIPAQDLRYVLPIIACASFFMVYYFGVSSAFDTTEQLQNKICKARENA